jgi:4-hydroxybenzoate polyprenyltransferase
VFQFVFWLFRGKAYFKARVSASARLNVERLPYRECILEDIREHAKLGREVLLVTGADKSIAGAVANHLGMFSRVLCSNGIENLTGETKAAAVARELDGRGFLYAGNSRADMPMWSKSTGAIAVNAPASCVKQLERMKKPVEIRHDSGFSARALLKAIRGHQWLKNLLVFTPIFLSHRMRELPLIAEAAIAFLAISLTASATYIMNDLLDLESDRKHPSKRKRPFASGAISIPYGIALCATMLAGAIAACFWLPPSARLILAGYAAASLAYSVRLKRIVSLDVVLLAMFYTTRILYGGAATQITITIWTLACSMFIFLSLALMKRVVELKTAAVDGNLSGRGYEMADFQLLSAQAAASAYLSILVVILYINSEQVHLLYRRPQGLWMLCPVLAYWLNRMLVMANRGKMHADPLVFALTDRASWWTALVALAIVWFSS